MDFSKRLSISYYKKIAVLNEEHQIYLVQHQENKKIFILKKLTLYNIEIYRQLQATPINGIPQIIELYEENKILTVIEEYISGETLQEKINCHNLDEGSIRSYISDLCHTLTKLHTFNPPIIHRDIKPSNIIITSYNRVILLDFNAAKLYTGIKSSDTILLGTKGYAAPEQYGFGSSTPQTDIYALGILLNELTSSLKIPTSKFDNLITKCTQLDPSDRFSSVDNLLSHLDYNDSCLTPPKVNFGTFALPGFRRHTPWRMVVATLGYLMILSFCLSFSPENVTGIKIWIERLFCLCMFLSVVFTSTNYLNIQRIIPLSLHKIRILRYLSLLVFDTILILALMIVMILVESFI